MDRRNGLGTVNRCNSAVLAMKKPFSFGWERAMAEDTRPQPSSGISLTADWHLRDPRLRRATSVTASAACRDGP